MAVYTHVSREALEQFLTQYDIGSLQSFQGITQGVENTNYIVKTDQDQFILTLFEKRVDEDDLPFFLSFMSHLASKGVNAPRAVNARSGEPLNNLCGRPAVFITFLTGRDIETPSADHCAQVGRLLAEMHLKVKDFRMSRLNDLSVTGWSELVKLCAPQADRCAPGLQQLIESEILFLTESWPSELPTGVVHADLFPDNVFFDGDEISGVIDFYFSCNDFLAYDLAITLNAWAGIDGWCDDRASSLFTAYTSIRPLTLQESHAMLVFLRGASFRFLLTRLYDWLHQIPGANVNVKDPLAYRDLLLTHRNSIPTFLSGIEDN